MADFLSLIGAIPGLIADFDGSTSNPYGPQQRQQAANLAQIASAQTDTTNPLYKQLYGQYQDQNRQNMAQTIAEAQGQNRMNVGMGRTPLFDPNRGGETIFRNLMQGYQNSGVQSDQQTRAALQQAAGTTGAAGNLYGAINSQAARAGSAQVQGYTGIENMLRNILGGNNGNRNNYSQVAGVGSQSPYDPRNQTPTSNAPMGYQPPYNPNSGWGGYQ